MQTRHLPLAALAALALAGCAPAAQAQSGLAARVTAAPGTVQFTFAAREGVCGNGRSYYSTRPGSFTGSFTTSVDETLRSEPCVAGPVRVVLARADGQIVDVDTYVGPPQAADGATDLGRVGAREAADYLLGLAARLEGSPSRAALAPAMLADSASTWGPLLAIARDRDRPLDTRRSAVSWLARGAGAEADEAQVVRTLLALAGDADDRQPVRARAVSALAGLEHGAGLAPLIALAERGDDAWLRQQALNAIAGSGDPRARRWLREVVQAGTLAPALQRVAVRGVGRSSHATGSDADFLRAHYARAASAEVKEEILRAVASLGGAENERWLLGIARADTEPTDLRRRAVQLAGRSETVEVRDLVALYDATADRRLKQDLIGALANRREPAATDKLLAIARSPDDRTLQRQAINRLSRSDEPRVREALAAIVGHPSHDVFTAPNTTYRIAPTAYAAQMRSTVSANTRSRALAVRRKRR